MLLQPPVVETPEADVPEAVPETAGPETAVPETAVPGSESREEPLEVDPAGSGLREKPEDSEALDARVKAQLKAERAFRRGLRKLDKGQNDEALTCFEQAAELCPDELRFALYVVFGQHALAPDDEAAHNTALERMERACEEDPTLAAAHLLRARLLTSAGRTSEARDAYGRVLTLEPAHRVAKRELKALNAS